MSRRVPNLGNRPRSGFAIAMMLAILCFTSDIIAADKAEPGGKDEIKAIVEAWQKRFELSRSWKCVVDAELMTPKGQSLKPDDDTLSEPVRALLKTAGPFPFEDTACPVPFVLSVDRQAGRHHLESTDSVLDTTTLKHESRLRVSAYNGKLVWSEFPHLKGANGVRKVALHSQSMIEFVYLPVYFAHGLFPHETAVIDWDHPERSTAARLKLIVDGTKVIGGIRCVRIRNPTDDPGRKFNIYADPQREYAVVRWELVTLDGLRRSIDVTEYRMQAGLHLPFRWQTVHFGGGGFGRPQPEETNPVPSEKFNANVKNYEVNPRLDKSLFEIPGDGEFQFRDHRPKK